MSARTAHDFTGGETPSAAVLDTLAKGTIGWNERTNNASVTDTDTQLLAEDVTVLSARLIAIDVLCELKGPAQGAAEVAVRVFRDTTLLGRCIIGVGQQDNPTTEDQATAAFTVFDKGPTSGVHTYKVTARIETYVGFDPGEPVTVIVNPGIECRMSVEDRGGWPL